MLEVWVVAFNVVSREASCVFRKLMSPEMCICVSLINPVGIHETEQVIAAKCFDESVNTGASVRRNRLSIRYIRRGPGVKLP